MAASRTVATVAAGPAAAEQTGVSAIAPCQTGVTWLAIARPAIAQQQAAIAAVGMCGRPTGAGADQRPPQQILGRRIDGIEDLFLNGLQGETLAASAAAYAPAPEFRACTNWL